MHAYTIIQGLRAEVTDVVTHDAAISEDLEVSQEELHVLREALATYVPSHR